MAKEKKTIPFDFVIENLYSLNPTVRPMFGAHALYIGEKIVLILRNKNDIDSGVWIATTPEHHASLGKLFKSMRSIRIFGTGTSSWQVLPMSADDFEESVNTVCELILRNDERIGTFPKKKKKKDKPAPSKKAAPAVKKSVKTPPVTAKKTAKKVVKKKPAPAKKTVKKIIKKKK
jgi:hypothetical protein